jgi:hypothetical protein
VGPYVSEILRLSHFLDKEFTDIIENSQIIMQC